MTRAAVPREIAAAPLWLRGAAALVRRVPWGKYRASRRLGSLQPKPFVATMPADVGGASFYCDLADLICREVYFTGRYEPAKTQLARALVAPGDMVVDLGANWGYFTLACAHWTGPSGRVAAFEPDPRLFDLLQGNVALNRLSHISIEQRAVGESRGCSRFVGYADGSENRGVTRRALTGDVAGAFEAETVPLDEWCAAEGVGRVRLVKMDIEGDEHRALRGMAAGLQSAVYDCVLLECHPHALREQGIDLDQAIAPLRSAGYRLDVIDLSRDAYRAAARGNAEPSRFLEPYDGQPVGDWPHLLATSPGVVLPW